MPAPMAEGRGEATQATIAANRRVAEELPLDDERDFEDARRGLIASLPGPVESADGRSVWDIDAYSFLEHECPPTANPSLWRQGRLCAVNGLFEIAPGFYEVRGLDISNMHLVEGDEGVVVIDPLVSVETAAAALALYREHRGERPVTGLLYTHSHIDHFGGARGVVSPEQVESGDLPVLAPAGFVSEAVSENVYAGPAMARRAAYMYAAGLERGPAGQIGTGLGMTNSTGTPSLIPPTVEIGETGREEVVDGVRMTFQLTPGTEAPAEMNVHFPDQRLLCIADNALRTMHNTLTLRGALVRDARVWSAYLNETIELYGRDSDALFAGHTWPLWGRERVVEFLAKQRDLYGYLHDQTLRLINKGYTGAEIAETIELPPSLAGEWHCRGYYGSVSHNVKGIYQRYMGWFDGNPARLWEHPPAEAARRYVEFMGGAERVLELARESFERGDYRWVATVVNHVVFADPDNEAARELQASALEQLGYATENGTWRNFFLMGAKELREGISGSSMPARPLDFVARLTVSQILDAMALRVDGPRAWEARIRLTFAVTDSDERYALNLENGVLTHVAGREAEDADATLRFERGALNELVAGISAPEELFAAGRFQVEGDGAKLAELFSLLDEPDPGFAIVTP